MLENDEGDYVGIVNLRHCLNEALRQGAGHIGYGIRPEYRGRGYATAALHPFNASGWDRDEVYPYFGFDTILFYPDFTYRDTLRTYVSDESSFKQIIDLYENKDEDTPVFIFEDLCIKMKEYAKLLYFNQVF